MAGLFSHAEGRNTIASGLASHAEGQFGMFTFCECCDGPPVEMTWFIGHAFCSNCIRKLKADDKLFNVLKILIKDI